MPSIRITLVPSTFQHAKFVGLWSPALADRLPRQTFDERIATLNLRAGRCIPPTIRWIVPFFLWLIALIVGAVILGQRLGQAESDWESSNGWGSTSSAFDRIGDAMRNLTIFIAIMFVLLMLNCCCSCGYLPRTAAILVRAEEIRLLNEFNELDGGKGLEWALAEPREEILVYSPSSAAYPPPLHHHHHHHHTTMGNPLTGTAVPVHRVRGRGYMYRREEFSTDIELRYPDAATAPPMTEGNLSRQTSGIGKPDDLPDEAPPQYESNEHLAVP